ncbi:MAG: 3-phosphoshikimate 1-carboxyvinyltransferase [Saprospiraceae bacterium]|nr:3-phosphoshikimate 1-carboxyvinyltransferase [Saprospiraceae bacterium]MDW8484415.1 3-phosphoshikimate 1-carboxyvinyltransferase [Saprospiraceae bacterium]
MQVYRLSHPTRQIGTKEQPVLIHLNSSKSISNRALIVNALRGSVDPAEGIENLSTAADTRILLRLLRERPQVCDVGDGGTTFRFLTAFWALQEGCRVLTGSARMQERPIGPLVDALKQLGVSLIEYLKREGYPPLRICGPIRPRGAAHAQVAVSAHVSSQFVSALMLVGPYLPGGLRLKLTGPLVSASYIRMTRLLMEYFGAEVTQPDETTIVVEPGLYRFRPLRIEADWSAASYWYSIAALAKSAHLVLEGLTDDSWQGDRMAAQMAIPFGVRTEFEWADGRPRAYLYAAPADESSAQPVHLDFTNCPDLAQTFIVLCAAKGQFATYDGLQTLPLKETDRCAALQAELPKIGIAFEKLSQAPTTYFSRKFANWNAPVRFSTYGDHRMAMALAPLALIKPIEIENPEVVDKSYPQFWEHLQQAGFTIEEFTI